MKNTINGLGKDLKVVKEWFKDPYITINIDWRLRKKRPFENENTDGDYEEPPVKEWESDEPPVVCNNTQTFNKQDFENYLSQEVN